MTAPPASRYAGTVLGRAIAAVEALDPERDPLEPTVLGGSLQGFCPACDAYTLLVGWDDGLLNDVFLHCTNNCDRDGIYRVLDIPHPSSKDRVDEAAVQAAIEEDRYERDIAERAYQLRVSEAARARVTAENTPPAPPFDLDTVAGVLARAPQPPFRVARLMPPDGSHLFSAMRKTGKTTSTLNLAWSLLTGEPFLGAFEVQPLDGTIAFLNFEVSAETVANWARLVGVNSDRLHLVNLRGRRNPLAYDEDRQSLGRLLRAREVETVIVDPFTRAFTGTDQNDASQVGPFLNTLDVFVRSDVGARDLILTAHTGWDGERSRGSSELEGWADSIIRLLRGKDDDHSRYIRAEGRDVDLDEQQLAFDPDTHRLTLTGHGSRTEARAKSEVQAGLPDVITVLTTYGSITQSECERRLQSDHGHGQKEARRLVKASIEHGVAETQRLGQAIYYRLAGSPKL